MVDHIQIDGDEVKVVTLNVDGEFVGPVGDADTIRIFLAKTPLEEILPKLRRGDRRFLASVMGTATSEDVAAVMRVWRAIRTELTDGEQEVLGEAFPEGGIDHAIANTIILKFLYGYSHPKLVRSDIADAARSIDSLSKAAKRIAIQVADIAKALEYETSEDINFTATHASLAVDEAFDNITNLQELMAELAEKRDIVIGLGRRSNSVRRRFAREWITLWQAVGLAVDADIAEKVIAAAVEAVELPSTKAKNGKDAIGDGQREWVAPLIKESLAN